MKSEHKKVVILGGGFGGVYALKELENVCVDSPDIEVTLVNKNNFFLFTPLLHEVATGNLSPDCIVEPIRSILKKDHSDFFLGDVKKIKLQNKEVLTSNGKIKYDYLVVALGSETNFYGIPGAEKHSIPLKTLKCAVRLKNLFIQSFEKATKIDDKEKIKELLTFVIVGGGATGVELAAEMADFLKGTFKKFYPAEITSLVSIILIQNNKELVPQFPPKIRERSLRSLEGKGIDVLLNTKVSEVFKDRIVLDEGKEIKTSKVVWTAGVKPIEVLVDDNNVFDDKKKFIANQFLQLLNYPEVFVLGDGATFTDSDTGKPLPALAQVATKQAKVVAKNIKFLIRGKDPIPFEYKSSGTLISLGEWTALGHIGGIVFGGKFAWWLWRTVYLSKIISKTKRVKVALDWTIDLFFPRDISEL